MACMLFEASEFARIISWLCMMVVCFSSTRLTYNVVAIYVHKLIRLCFSKLSRHSFSSPEKGGGRVSGGNWTNNINKREASSLCPLCSTSPMLIGPSILLMFHVRFVWSICRYKFGALYYAAFVSFVLIVLFLRDRNSRHGQTIWFDCDRD